MSTSARPDEVFVRLPSHPRFLPLVRALAAEGAEAAGFRGEDRERIVLGVTEGVTNVMRHGYRGATDQAIDLRLYAPPGTFRLEIEDYGEFVDPAQIRSRALEDLRPGGLGVHLMRSTMDSVEYRKNEHGGTTLTLLRRRAEPEPSPPPEDHPR